MHNIRESIHAQLPWLCPVTRALIDALLLSRGPVGHADVVARRVGLRSRFQLADLLRARGLPPLHRLAGWMSIISWTQRWEHSGASLADSALRVGIEPAAASRLVQRVTGRSWSAVRGAGSDWALGQFLSECGDSKRKRRGRIPAAP